MRISNNMGYGAFSYNIANLQEAKYKDTLRQMTGAKIISIADEPGDLMDVKKLTAARNQRANFINVIDFASGEMRSAEDQVNSMVASLQSIRDLSISSANAIYDGSVAAVGTYIKGIITDIIRNSNYDFNGKYLFSGTKTTSAAIQADYPPPLNDMPFELVEGTPTAANPSGLQVMFKGNLDKRTINKDTHSTEVINMTAEDLFGSGGTEAFEAMIGVYNILVYNKDGSPRKTIDSLDREEKQEIADLQQKIAVSIDNLSKSIGDFASRRVRMEDVSQQMQEEIVRLDEVKSLRADADLAKVTADLAKEEVALQYTLQAASQLSRRSLFDFLG